MFTFIISKKNFLNYIKIYNKILYLYNNYFLFIIKQIELLNIFPKKITA